MRFSILLLIAFQFISGSLAFAQGFDSLIGSWEAKTSGDYRTVTVSKVTVDKHEGQPRVHVWYYGQPNDIDWGTGKLREYSLPGYPSEKRWSAQMDHNGDDSILIFDSRGENELAVDAYTSRAASDDRHPSLSTNDILHRVAVSK